MQGRLGEARSRSRRWKSVMGRVVRRKDGVVDLPVTDGMIAKVILGAYRRRTRPTPCGRFSLVERPRGRARNRNRASLDWMLSFRADSGRLQCPLNGRRDRRIVRQRSRWDPGVQRGRPFGCLRDSERPGADLGTIAGSFTATGRGRSARPSAPAARPMSRQGQAVNWDDIIIDAAATDTGMRRSNNQDSYTVVRRLHARGLAAARPRLHGRRRDGCPRRRRAGQQDGLRPDPAQLHEDPGGHAVRGDHQDVPRRQRPDPQPGHGQSRLPGDGHDLLGAPAPARGCPDRARGRFAGLPDPRSTGSISSRSITAWSGSWSGATT